jgi:hypothetical protein
VPLNGGSVASSQIVIHDLLRNGLREGRLVPPKGDAWSYAPRRGRFGRRAGGPTIFSGPSRSATGTYSRSRSPV